MLQHPMKRNIQSFNSALPIPPLAIKIPALKSDADVEKVDEVSEEAPTPRYLKDLVKKKQDPMSSSAVVTRKLMFPFLLLIGSLFYIFNWISASTHIVKPISDHRGVITIVLNTFKRPDALVNSVKHYSFCKSVGYIYIVWSEKNPPLALHRLNIESMSSEHTKISFLVHRNDSLNNRFMPIKEPHTDAIFTVDDDIRVPCTELELGYEIWSNSPRAIVGFMPRLHMRGSHGGYIYRCWWSVWWHGMYSIILTKAAFLHHDFFLSYTHVMPSSIRSYVDSIRNCEDIAMQFHVANTTHRPPIYLKGHLTDLGAFNGISTSENVVLAGHMDRRSQCLTDLTSLYGSMPLVPSNIIVDAASNGWTSAPSTWLEYISSDLWNFDAGATTPSTVVRKQQH